MSCHGVGADILCFSATEAMFLVQIFALADLTLSSALKRQ